MSEYIIDMGNSSYQSTSGLLRVDASHLREEIVRCGSCRFYDWDGDPSEVYLDRYWCDKLTVYMPAGGFCSFGERDAG